MKSIKDPRNEVAEMPTTLHKARIDGLREALIFAEPISDQDHTGATMRTRAGDGIRARIDELESEGEDRDREERGAHSA